MNRKQWMVGSVLAICLTVGAGLQHTLAQAGTRVYVGFDVGGYTPYNGYATHVDHRPPPPPRYGWGEPPPPPPRGWHRRHPPPYWHRECRPWHHRHHRWSHDRYDRW